MRLVKCDLISLLTRWMSLAGTLSGFLFGQAVLNFIMPIGNRSFANACLELSPDFYLSVSVCLSAVSVSLSVCLSLSLFVCLSVCLSLTTNASDKVE